VTRQSCLWEHVFDPVIATHESRCMNHTSVINVTQKYLDTFPVFCFTCVVPGNTGYRKGDMDEITWSREEDCTIVEIPMGANAELLVEDLFRAAEQVGAEISGEWEGMIFSLIIKGGTHSVTIPWDGKTIGIGVARGWFEDEPAPRPEWHPSYGTPAV